jgi:hypothetical protein
MSLYIRVSVEREGQNTTVGGKVFNVQKTCFGPKFWAIIRSQKYVRRKLHSVGLQVIVHNNLQRDFVGLSAGG